MMAIRHGLAGQFGKSEAAQRTWRVFLVIVVITCLGFLGYGFVWGYCARNWGNVWGGLAVIVPVVVCAVILWIAWRRF